MSMSVILQTSLGPIQIELFWRETPKTCRNFLELCKSGYYDGLIFHVRQLVEEFHPLTNRLAVSCDRKSFLASSARQVIQMEMAQVVNRSMVKNLEMNLTDGVRTMRYVEPFHFRECSSLLFVHFMACNSMRG